VTSGRRAAVLAIFLVGCGLKNAPIAPERVRPMPPGKLAAGSVADGVRLTWRRPVAYTGGGRMRDLGRFEIERAATPTGPFVRVGTLTLADQQRFRQQRDLEWTDHEVVRGGDYAYRVIAFTVDGTRSAPSSVVQIHYLPATDARPRDAR
jgi:hypothetical protein